MVKMTKQLAKNLVDKLMSDIPYNINIISNEGYIIASGMTDREGDFHPSGKKAADNKETVIVYEDGDGEKKGYNKPIIINDEVVAVVGISGEPDDVGIFSNILSTTARLILQQEIEVRKHHEYLVQKENLLYNLLNQAENPYNPSQIKLMHQYFKISIQAEVSVAFLESNDAIEEYYTSYETSLVAFKNGYLFFKNSRSLANDLISFDQIVFIDTCYRLKDGVQNVWQTYLYHLIMNIDSHEQVILAKDYPHFLLNEEGIDKSLLKKEALQKLDDELIFTLKSFVKHNMSPKESSKELHLHRNSLNYRIEKIKELTGYDPKKINDLMILAHALISLQKSDYLLGLESI